MDFNQSFRIVSATPEDAAFIAWIVAQGMHFDDVPGFLEDVCAREDTLYSWKNTRLLMDGDKPIGGLVSYDGGTHEEGVKRTWVMPDGKRISSGEESETDAGEWYLDSLAILPEYRGRALWRPLFDDAIALAREHGFHRACLIYDNDYPHLGRIYSSYGFKPLKEFMYFGAMNTKMTLAC